MARIAYPHLSAQPYILYRMPAAAAKICTHSGCHSVVAASSPSRYCTAHAPLHPAWQNRTVEQRLLTGRALQRERKRMLQHDPLCVLCRAAGRVAAGTIRDHIVPLAEGGADTVDNTQLLCAACHTQKSQAESQRGRQRAAVATAARPAALSAVDAATKHWGMA